MRNVTLCFSGGDERMRWARAYLERRGIPCTDVPGTEATHLILPPPAFREVGIVSGGPPLDALLEDLPKKLSLFGGRLGTEAEALTARGYTVRDYFADERLTAENAAITAEGALQLAMDALPVTLWGSAVLVIGWGRIGQLLARRLVGLGAEVTVAARKPRDRAMIEALGMRSEETGAYHRGLSQYRAIINTVPAAVLSQEQTAQTWPDCLLIELSSGGSMEPAGRQQLAAGGLPGKTAPETAGLCIGRAIFRLLQEEKESI